MLCESQVVLDLLTFGQGMCGERERLWKSRSATKVIDSGRFSPQATLGELLVLAHTLPLLFGLEASQSQTILQRQVSQKFGVRQSKFLALAVHLRAKAGQIASLRAPFWSIAVHTRQLPVTAQCGVGLVRWPSYPLDKYEVDWLIVLHHQAIVETNLPKGRNRKDHSHLDRWWPAKTL